MSRKKNQKLVSAFGAIALRSAFAMAAVGCSASSMSGPSGGTVEDADHVAMQTIGASGGVLVTNEGTTIDIPAGALTGDTTIIVQPNDSAPSPKGVDGVGGAFTFTPDGLQFLKPVTVTMVFDPSRLPSGTNASQIVIYTAKDGSSTYEALPTTAMDATHVQATTTHFCTNVPGIPIVADAGVPPTDAGHPDAGDAGDAGDASDAADAGDAGDAADASDALDAGADG
ncbi:MAG: hypothetical protein ABIP89_11890 [Polyangiaceae bacterium]